MDETIKVAILAFMEKKRKTKSRLPMKDIVTALQKEGLERRPVKMTLLEMVDTDVLKVWSSGSSSYYMMPEDFERVTNMGADGQA